MQNNNKLLKFTALIKNLRGFFLKKRKKRVKHSSNEENLNESDFFKTLKNLIISSLKKEYIIKFFKKPHSMRTKIETRSVTEYLLLNEKNIFFNSIKKFGIYKLYSIIQVLNIEFYKKGEIIFQYKDSTNKFVIILEGNISLYLPYFHKKLMTIKNFLDYFFYLKENFPKTFELIEHRNQNLYVFLQKLKNNKYDIKCLSDINKQEEDEFYIEDSQKVCEISEGNSFGEIALLYNLPRNFNIIADNDVYLLTMNKSDFMKVMRNLLENEILYKEFGKLRKFSYIFNTWSNFSLGQIMNYFIPIKKIKKEILYNQKDFSDSFYIIKKGSFDVYCDLSLSEYSKYKNYVIKNNKNILDWIKEQKEKHKLNTDKIIEYINYMKNNNCYPKDKDDIDKNLLYIKKRMLEQDQENSQQLINIKLNEDILSEKNTKIRIKVLSLNKNDFIGVCDSLELKSRFYSVECTSDKGELNKIRIIDFIIFNSFNHGLDLQNIYDYLRQKKKDLVDRVYKNLDIYLNNNKRIIKNVYSLAFNYFDKRNNMKLYKENEFTIKNMKNLYTDSDGNNNLIDRIRKSNNNKKRVYMLTQPENNNNIFKRRQTRKKTNFNLMDANIFIYEGNKEKPKIRIKSGLSFDKSYSSSNKKSRKNQTFNINSEKNSNSNNNFFKDKLSFIEKEENFKSKNYNSMTIAPVMYDKKFELIEYKYLSFDNKLEKSLNNFLGIYNTKREKSQKIFDYKDNRTKIKNRIKNFDRKKLFFYEGLNEKFIKKPRVMSAYTPSVKNKMRKNKNEEFMSLIKFLDKSKRNEIYKN